MPIGTTGLEVGITAESYGLIQSAEKTTEVETTDALDASGQVVGFQDHSKKINGTVEYLHLSDSGNPDAQVGTGTAVTFSDSDLSGNWYVKKATKTKSNTEFTTTSIDMVQYPNLGS